jgi:hypothetical protein
MTQRDSRLGAWPNWFLGLSELVLRHPHADAFVMVQDDTLFCRNVRPFLERTDLLPGDIGVASLYCPQKYVQRQAGFHVVRPNGDLWGALAYVFPNAAARSLLSDASAIEHRRTGPHDGFKNIDTVVGVWAEKVGMPVYYVTPSLAQHIGDSSTIWPEAYNWDHRHAADFVGEDFDALTLLRPE